MLLSRISLLYSFSRDDSDFYKDLYGEVRNGLVCVQNHSVSRDFLDNGYRPVRFIHYIRTDKNLILCDKHGHSFFEDSLESSSAFVVYPNLLYDLSLQVGRNLILKLFSVSEHEDDFFAEFAVNSTCFPVGAVPDKDCFYIVSNIIISETYLNSLNLLKCDRFEFVPVIQYSLNGEAHKNALYQKFLKTYVLTKE